MRRELNMRKLQVTKVLSRVMAAVMVMAAVTGCGSRETAAVIEPEQVPLADGVDAAEDQTAVDDAVSEVPEVQYKVYEDPNEWKCQYDPGCIEVIGGGAQMAFSYTGECAGTNILMVTYTIDKDAEQAAKDYVSEWGEAATMTETRFPGTEDVKGYYVYLPAGDEGSGLYMVGFTRDYLEGALLFEFTGHKSGNEEMDIAVSDAFATIFDTLEFVEEATDPANEAAAEATTEAAAKLPAYEYPGPEYFYLVLYSYLDEELGQYFDRGDVSIPCPVILCEDDSDSSDIKVYGDFWFYNYNLNGDVLETLGGGSFPGCIHIKTTESGDYEVTSFEQVGDGSDFEPTAKKIFGEHYDAFMKAYSDSEATEATRAQIIANYVAANNLSITSYKDFGWDPVVLPEENIDSFYSTLD